MLDLGSGGGIDVILSAKRVGPTGTAYGLDMTDEMLALARANVAEAGVTNVHFLKGVIEQIPLPADSIDVVISNCVINLSVDKPAVLTEIARVLKPGGRIGISDIVAEDRLSPDERAERGSFVGCIAGALSKGEYEAGLEAAGFEHVSVEFTHQVADGMHGAIVRAEDEIARDEGSAGNPASRARRLLLGQELSHRGQLIGENAEVGPASALLTLDEACLEQHLQVVTDCRLCQPEWLDEMADARFAVGCAWIRLRIRRRAGSASTRRTRARLSASVGSSAPARSGGQVGVAVVIVFTT